MTVNIWATEQAHDALFLLSEPSRENVLKFAWLWLPLAQLDYTVQYYTPTSMGK